jgi:release factor glutamine methyltransferase
MTSVNDRLVEARRRLEAAGLTPAAAAIDAEVLARHALGWDRARLLTDGRDPAPAGFDQRFTSSIDRRAKREPVAYITGEREFWGMTMVVTSDVLIPRPETEMIVEAACDELSPRERVRSIVDVGTGTGCLAIALACEFPAARIVATDLSAAALDVAARNVRTHVDGRVTLVRTNLLDAIAGPIDVIVSNPPYVPSGVRLSPDIARFEPALALYADEDGLGMLACVIADARHRVAKNGLFVVEFGFGQDTRVMELAYSAGWRDVTIKEDLQGIPRVAVMRNIE